MKLHFAVSHVHESCKCNNFMPLLTLDENLKIVQGSRMIYDCFLSALVTLLCIKIVLITWFTLYHLDIQLLIKSS